jgi:hypothetical protein
MAALATRADRVGNGEYYLTPLPLTGDTADDLKGWVNSSVDGEQTATLIGDGKTLLGAGDEFERPQTATRQDEQGKAQPVSWSERVRVTRSLALAQAQQAHLEQRLARAAATLLALTPAPGKGKRQIREETALRQAIQQTLERYRVQDLLTVEWEPETTTRTRYRGRGRPGRSVPPSPKPRCAM